VDIDEAVSFFQEFLTALYEQDVADLTEPDEQLEQRIARSESFMYAPPGTTMTSPFMRPRGMPPEELAEIAARAETPQRRPLFLVAEYETAELGTCFAGYVGGADDLTALGYQRQYWAMDVNGEPKMVALYVVDYDSIESEVEWENFEGAIVGKVGRPVAVRGLQEPFVERYKQNYHYVLGLATGKEPAAGADRTSRSRAIRSVETGEPVKDVNWVTKHLTVTAHNGDVAAVTSLLGTGADVNDVDRDGWTALRAAARGGQLAVVEVLLAAGADVQAFNSDHRNALTMAIDGIPNGRPVEFSVVVTRDGHTVSLTDRDEIRAEIGSHPDDEYDRHVAVAWRLLQAGIEVDLPDSEHHQTPLIRSAIKGSVEITKAIVETGQATLDHSDRVGFTALLYASQLGHLGVVQVLLTAGASPNVKEKHGFTPLHEAASAGHVDVVRALLGAGADRDAGLPQAYEDFPANSTPRNLAALRHHQVIVDLIDAR
jgi:Ankyrin repeats (many copies)/Ankyrin repeats (3 copies)/Ankyrin repeat